MYLESEFQPPAQEQEPEDEKWERWFVEKEKNGYAVLSRDEWRARLDGASLDGYAEGRKDQLDEFAAMLPGPVYMDPPDGGGVTVQEQFRRMAEDARMWREHDAAKSESESQEVVPLPEPYARVIAYTGKYARGGYCAEVQAETVRNVQERLYTAEQMRAYAEAVANSKPANAELSRARDPGRP